MPFLLRQLYDLQSRKINKCSTIYIGPIGVRMALRPSHFLAWCPVAQEESNRLTAKMAVIIRVMDFIRFIPQRTLHATAYYKSDAAIMINIVTEIS